MNREIFLKLIEQKGFKKVKEKFVTTFENDGWFDGYNTKYILEFHHTPAIKFTIDKLSVGGFSGTQEIKQRLFDGSISTEDDFENVLKYINFREKE